MAGGPPDGPPAPPGSRQGRGRLGPGRRWGGEGSVGGQLAFIWFGRGFGPEHSAPRGDCARFRVNQHSPVRFFRAKASDPRAPSWIQSDPIGVYFLSTALI